MDKDLAVHFTTHYNWSWVVFLALKTFKPSIELQDGGYLISIFLSVAPDGTQCKENGPYFCNSLRNLPSNLKSSKNEKQEYSLFRLDLCKESFVFHIIRLQSLGFADLDPKDLLYHRLALACGLVYAQSLMPKTILIPYNSSMSDILSLTKCLEFPMLLKAPMGSGGFGLYFVFSSNDISTVMNYHLIKAQQAQEKSRFLETLMNGSGYNDAGVLPCWSLQSIISPVLCKLPAKSIGQDGAPKDELRRSQVRVYVILCDTELYIYNVFEARLPSWDINLEGLLQARTSGDNSSSGFVSEAYERECCEGSTAVPYNEGRNKGKTERFLLSELEELSGELVKNKIIDCVKRTFLALKPSIMSRHSPLTHPIFDSENFTEENCPTSSNMAIVGVDLLVANCPQANEENKECGYEVYVVEVNNNPAMPGEEKNMSAAYRQHLVELVQSMSILGLHPINDREKASSEKIKIEGEDYTRYIQRKFTLID